MSIRKEADHQRDRRPNVYRNSNQPPEQQQAPPESSSREIAVFERPGKGRGPDTELRMDLSEYMGYPFVNLRLWTKGPDGSWYPTRKGLSIKIRECKNLADSLLEAARLASVAQNRAAGPQRGGQRSETPRRDRGEDRRQGGLPLAGQRTEAYDPDFDEFNG